MRVLLPTIDAPPARGGVARYIDAIVRTLPDVDIVVPADARYTTLWRLLRARRRTHGALWVHHVLPLGTVAWISRSFGGVPYTIFLHGLDFDLARRSTWKRWLTRRILRGAAHIVVNSHALQQEVSVFARTRTQPIVVYPCVDDALVARARTLHAVPVPGVLRLLTVGRLVERKGHRKVLEALRHIPQAQYTIVGDGPTYTDICARIREYGLADRVIVRTDLTDAELPSVYANADVFVMPSTKSTSDREGFGIVYIEAALFGVPSIAVRQPGVDEAVRDGETGVLVDDTPDALLAALRRLEDVTYRETLGGSARRRVLHDFTREAQFARLRALL